ncbi:MAG: nucleotidyl transferase AbiEii/AbiGii toxin family protein [Thermoanaerobaculia bacterium]
MNDFTDQQVEALSAILNLWPNERLTLVGASAIGCFMEMRWRQTYDLDVSVCLAIEEASEGLGKLSGWKRHPSKEHEWTSPENVRIDVIPAAPKHLESGRLTWPESGVEMSLVGLRLAFENREPIAITPDVTVHVAPVPVVAVLKMAAYLDRPSERQRDLEDLAFILEDYLHSNAEERFSKDIFDLGLTYEQTSAYVLGQRVGAMLNQTERNLVFAFVAKVEDEMEPLSTQARMAQLGPLAWRRDPNQLLQRIAAFKLGIDRKSR